MRFFQFKIPSQPIPAAESVGCYERAIAYFSQLLLKKLDLLAVTAWSGYSPINISVFMAFVRESLTFFHPSPRRRQPAVAFPPNPASSGESRTPEALTLHPAAPIFLDIGAERPEIFASRK